MGHQLVLDIAFLPFSFSHSDSQLNE